MVSSTPRPHFTPGKDPVPILQDVGRAPGPVWTGGKSRLNRDSIPDRPARSSVDIPTELPGPHIINILTYYVGIFYVKVKAWTGPESSRRLRGSRISRQSAHEGGKVVSLKHRPPLPPGKTRYPLYKRLGAPQGRSGRAENLVPTGIRSRTVQPVVSRCTD